MLHNEKELFETVILDTSEAFHIDPVIIEKDYYVTLFLKEIVKLQPEIIFKGGTSLSKCYHLINRFSEDIDLTLEGDSRPTEGQRKKLSKNIKEIIDKYDFKLNNADETRSRRDFNRYEVNVNSIFSSSYLKHDLIIETAVFLRSYPSVKLKAASLIYDYLKSIERSDVINSYNLGPFQLQVQAVERTFIDKLFALGDYYISSKTDEHSRHLYDLHRMLEVVKINDDLRTLYVKVREERKNHKACYSAQDDINFKNCLQEIVDKDIYKSDYKAITKSLIFDDVSYETVKRSLQKIIDSGLFD